MFSASRTNSQTRSCAIFNLTVVIYFFCMLSSDGPERGLQQTWKKKIVFLCLHLCYVLLRFYVALEIQIKNLKKAADWNRKTLCD